MSEPSKKLLDKITTETGMSLGEAKRILKIVDEARKEMGEEAWLGFMEFVERRRQEEKTDETTGRRMVSLPELIADYLRQKSLRIN